MAELQHDATILRVGALSLSR